MREVNASEEQEQESSEWNVRELSGSEFDELSAASRYGGFQLAEKTRDAENTMSGACLDPYANRTA